MPARGGIADLDRAGRTRAARGRHHQPELQGRRCRARLCGAGWRRHRRPQYRAHGRAGREPRGPCSRAVARRAPLGAGRHGARLRRGADLRGVGRPRPGEPRPPGRSAAPLPPRDPEALPWAGADLLGLPGCARLCASAGRERQPAWTRTPRPARRVRSAGGRRRPGRDRLRPQRPAARQHPRRWHPPLAGGLGVCGLQLRPFRPRRPRLERRHVPRPGRRGCSPLTTDTRPTTPCAAAPQP